MHHSSTTGSNILAGLLTAVLLSGATNARAQDAATTTTQSVSVGNLDLRTTAGVHELRRRIAIASNKVCGPAEIVGSTGYLSYVQCANDAQRKAAARADSLIASAQEAMHYASAAPPR